MVGNLLFLIILGLVFLVTLGLPQDVLANSNECPEGQVLSDSRCGERKLGTIHGQKYEDLNKNGQRENGDPYLNGWTIFLDKNNNETLDAGEKYRITHDDPQGNPGHYWFTELLKDNYTVCEVLQNNWVQTQPGSPQNSQCYDVTIDSSGQKVTGQDFGNSKECPTGQVLSGNDCVNSKGCTSEQVLSGTDCKLGSIYGQKYEDLNGDGNHDSGEPYLNGWTIFLDENNNETFDSGEQTNVTHDDLQGNPGYYWFTELLKDNYTVCERFTK